MSWTYRQVSGWIVSQKQQVWQGYSGFRRWKNDPQFQFAHAVGPVPVGKYKLWGPFEDPVHGPLCFKLLPQPGTETYGRTGLMIHGASVEHPGSASHGCICLPHEARNEIGMSGDLDLEVV